ncbi:Nonstructural polyprotein [Sleeping disease virus]|uniref:Polyprotein P1234 n=13 Tax=Alphavirus salmon subtype 2 TaxID=78540 RepID=POLN_SAV2|nr:Nonstructural polyprotein [Sleeping disease virus]Q8QL53.1 RecName: Full=Polyprotein P1234; Short=P1234; AltName: Full=Non-structural polyprotein; Contains: RecName: Full=Polyprotein P123; Short=P123; Contains: RecName: Full=mRNA-capping enzyme nsP1; AltName: Full=Non-structural protein 1; Contains: RecName: Full=Protease nsP2; AltName: Full=Non-structural protein 2; Short=nsP2; Contains: RecName: Full=Non-structural protein 3; Short=nsP3; Contains: RecName: Full=RNA-directed RNA polymerase nsP
MMLNLTANPSAGTTVTVDLPADHPALNQFKTAFPGFEVVASNRSSNDHAAARAFSHLATKWIERDIDGRQVIVADIGSAPARRVGAPDNVTYHSVCPRKCAEDPERLASYARKLVRAVEKGDGHLVSDRITDLKDVLENPDTSLETTSICLNDDVSCKVKADIAVYQDVYAVDAPSTIYAQADKGTRVVYWIGFEPFVFHTDAMAGSFPLYDANWSDSAVLAAKNLPLCYSGLSEDSIKWRFRFRDKPLVPSGEIHYSVGSTHYVEDRDKLKSWHLPSTFHFVAPNKYTCRCDTVVSCGGYVVKKITICEGIVGRPANEELATSYHRDGVVVTKFSDTINHEQVSFPVVTYIPAVICDQMTAMTADPVKYPDVVKLLVGLNQRIVVNGTTVRNVNSMDNSLIPVFARALCSWADEARRDMEDEQDMYGVTSVTTWICICRAYDKRQQHTFYRRPKQSSGIYVPAKFTGSLRASLSATYLNLPLKQLLLNTLKRAIKPGDQALADETEARAHDAAEVHELTEEEGRQQAANPSYIADVLGQDDEEEVDDGMSNVDLGEEDGVGSTIIDCQRGTVKVITAFGDNTMGEYLVLSPVTVLRTRKLAVLLGPLAEEVMQYVHKGRTGRYAIEKNNLKVLIPTGVSLKTAHFQALTESATLTYNDYLFTCRTLDQLATRGSAKNTDEVYYKLVDAAKAKDEYVYELSSKQCVKKEDATGTVLQGDICNPPYHQFAFEALRKRPAHTHDVHTIGIYGVPGAGKTAIITTEVTTRDLVASGKKENCEDIKRCVLERRGLKIAARTVDSLLYGAYRGAVDTLYVDEAYACHSGTLLALIAAVRPTGKVVLCGDPKQVGCVNQLQMRMHYNHEISDRVLRKNISRRCTHTLTAIVSNLNYEGRMKTTNPCKKPVLIDTTGSTKPDKEALVLTCFRGWVKDLKILYPHNELMTAAASQGLTREKVYAVRCRVTSNPLYEPTSEHITVLLTRTNDELVWKTLPNDPLIPILSKPPKGDYSATMEDWEDEHNGILAALREACVPRMNFAHGKRNTCWAVTSSRVLHEAGVLITPEDFNRIFPAFREDKPHSALAALDAVAALVWGLDTSSGILSGKGSFMRLENSHWSNSNRGYEYGLNLDALEGYEIANPRMIKALKQRRGRECYDIETGKLVPMDPGRVQVPINRVVPHVLVDTSAAAKPGFLENRLSVDRWDQVHSFKTRAAVKFAELTKRVSYNSVLDLGAARGGVTDYCVKKGKTVTCVSEQWDSKPRGAVVITADINGPLNNLGIFDLVFCDAAGPRRYHHYAQCEDHARRSTSACKHGVERTAKGGVFIVKAYGMADRRTERAVECTARYFKSVSVEKPVSSRITNVEVFFKFSGRCRPHARSIAHLGPQLTDIYARTRKAYKMLARGSVADKVKVAEILNSMVGAAPGYRVLNKNIITAEEEVLVNAANSNGRPGDGVCGALYGAFGDAFPNGAIGAGNAVLVRGLEATIIHAAGADFREVDEETGARQLRAAYRAAATLVTANGITSAAIPLLSTHIFSNGRNRLEQSFGALVEAFDTTECDVTIYCLANNMAARIQQLIDDHAREEFDEEVVVEEEEEHEANAMCDTETLSSFGDETVWVPKHSTLAGRPGYSATYGDRRSLFVGTKFHRAAVAMSSIEAAWPRTKEANAKLIEYIRGQHLVDVLKSCPVNDIPVGRPPSSLPCGCIYAMTPERVTVLKQRPQEGFVVCSAFKLPLTNIQDVTKVECTVRAPAEEPRPVRYLQERRPVQAAARQPRPAIVAASVAGTATSRRTPAPGSVQVRLLPPRDGTVSRSSRTSSQSSVTSSAGPIMPVPRRAPVAPAASLAGSVHSHSVRSAPAILRAASTGARSVRSVQSGLTGHRDDAVSVAGSVRQPSGPPSSVSTPAAPRGLTREQFGAVRARARRDLELEGSEHGSQASFRSGSLVVGSTASSYSQRPDDQDTGSEPSGRGAAVRTRRRGQRDGPGGYIFSSDQGTAHLSQHNTQTNNTTEVLMRTSVLPSNDHGTPDLLAEMKKRLAYQMRPTQKNKSRYLSAKVHNMKHKIVQCLQRGAGHYLREQHALPLWKNTFPKPRYSDACVVKFESVNTAIVAANMFIGCNYPTLSSFGVTDKYDAYLDMVDGLNCNLDTVTFEPAKVRSLPKKSKYNQPLIQSQVPGPMASTLQSILMAATKRNCNVTQMRELPTMDSAAMNVEAFKKFACKDTDLWTEFAEKPVRLSPGQIEEYVFHLQGAKANVMHSRVEAACPDLSEVAMDRFTLDMKRDVKVTPGTKHVEERPKVQVIQAADPMATAYLCAIHRELVRRLKAVLKPSIHVLFDMSSEDFDAIVGHGMKLGDKVLETDISSFDKSQDQAMAVTALMLLEDLGVEEDLLTLIEASFGDITSVHLPTGTRFQFGSMMKSGLFLTLFVNTLLNITIAARVLREQLADTRCAAFIGDDNVITGVVSDDMMVARCASWLNMEVKIMEMEIGDRSPYFCGGFLLLDTVTGTVSRVSDPVKRLMKMGKPALNDPETDVDRCRALREEVESWYRVGIQWPLQVAAATRYGVNHLPLATMAMATLAQDLRSYLGARGEYVSLYA